MAQIQEVLTRFPEVEEAVLFGSWANLEVGFTSPAESRLGSSHDVGPSYSMRSCLGIPPFFYSITLHHNEESRD